MSRIKSAIELAMENTSHIEIDPGAVKRAETQKKGKLNSALFLNGELEEIIPADMVDDDVYLTVVKETLLSNLKLPQQNSDLARVPRLESALLKLTDSKNSRKEITSLFGQIKNFFAQYLDSQEQLIEGLAAQYEPQLRQKEEMYRQKTGQQISLLPEQDPEFIKLLQEQQTQMDEQYNEVIKQAKEQIKELL
jgi:hypothetical protein